MPKTFFIADTHFGHGNIIKYEKRPFTSVDEMDETLIYNWNKVVSSEDSVYMLGDFAIAKSQRIKEIIEQLHGYKTLILGNHDRSHTVSWWLNAGFQEAIPYPIMLNEFFMLSHEPLYINENMPYVNIFGHVHSSPLYSNYSSQSFCVSVERIGYTPIEFEEIKNKILSLQS